MSDTVPIAIYTHTECRLCDKAETTIHEAAGKVSVAVDIDLMNVDSDEELREKYGKRVPYVYIDGRPTFKSRTDANRFGEKLTAARE